jgi:hypothetical protein
VKKLRTGEAAVQFRFHYESRFLFHAVQR